MSVSENIRALARDGLSAAEIARRRGIRYQHAYNVLKADGAMLTGATARSLSAPVVLATASTPSKPMLRGKELVTGGFTFSSRWILSEAGDLLLDRPLQKAIGVYAFARDGVALYVGVATMGLAKRLYFYAKPGVTRRTSQCLNGIIKSELQQQVPFIGIYTVFPPDLEWNGLPIHGSADLELGLIKEFALPWTMRSAG
jgi:hypothetical protein